MRPLNALLSACQSEETPLLAATHLSAWRSGRAGCNQLSEASPVGDDPGYDDDFQQMREEVNKLSGADTELICRLACRVRCTGTAKDVSGGNVLLLGEAAPRR